MVITGIIEGSVYCRDMGDVVISNVTGSITVKYRISGYGIAAATFEEVYFPDSAGNVIINGLGEVALDYFPDQEIKILHTTKNHTIVKNYIIIDADVYNASGNKEKTFSQSFYFSQCRTALSYNDKCFLNRFSSRMVREDQLVCVAYHCWGQTLVLGIAYKSEGVARFLKVNFFTNNTPGNSIIQYFSVDSVVERLNMELNASFTSDDIIYYEADLYSNGTLIDKIRYDIDRKHYPQITHFVFYNCFGFPETLYFTGRDERSSELEASFGTVMGDYLKVHTDLITSHTANTGYINESIRDCVEDMVHSNKVYLYQKDTLGDLITITGVEFTESKPRTEPLNIKLTYRVADKCQRTFTRARLPEKIFDKTFDSTFD